MTLIKIKEELKDWEIAREMFGSTTKSECLFVKKLRKNYELEYLNDDFFIVREKGKDCSGYTIHRSLLIDVLDRVKTIVDEME
jgi:hypothetical protein